MTFTEAKIQEVWERGNEVPPNDKNAYRKDECNAWIARDAYEDRDSDYGWEIDHITPLSKGGSDETSNLRPLQWENHAFRRDENLACVVTSSGVSNVRKP